jgi:hypothetical protein
LWKSGLSGPFRYLARACGIHGPAAEGQDAAAMVGDGEDDPVAETVVGRPALLRRDQQARLHQFAGLGALGDQVVFQSRAAGRRKAEPEARPLGFGQAAALQIGPRLPALGPAQGRLEPLGRRVHPVGKPLALALLLGGAGVGGGHGQAGLGGQALDRLHEGEPLGLLQIGDQVAVLARGEVEELALLVVHIERGGLLLVEGRQADIFPALLAQLHRPPDHVGWTEAGFDLLKEVVVDAHRWTIQRRRRGRRPPRRGGRRRAPPLMIVPGTAHMDGRDLAARP